MSFGGETLRISGITSIFGGDLLKVEDEFMTVKQVGFGSTNVLVFRERGWGPVYQLIQTEPLLKNMKDLITSLITRLISTQHQVV